KGPRFILRQPGSDCLRGPILRKVGPSAFCGGALRRARAGSALAVAMALGCATSPTSGQWPTPASPGVRMEEASAQAGSSSDAGGPVEVKKQAASLKAELLAKHGESQRDRIDRGVDQVFALWRSSDGDLSEFVRSHFIADPKLLETTLQRFEYEAEQLDGHFNEIIRELKRPTDLDLGPLLPVDPLLAAFDPSAHLTEDLFQARIAFEALLNFPLTTLEERLAHAREYSRRQWTEVRLTAKFSPRIPGEILQEIAQAASGADLYIAQYNIWMHHLISDKGERPFPKGLRLITHWNLRDELKGDYADPRGPEKQNLIIEVMERIVTQT